MGDGAVLTCISASAVGFASLTQPFKPSIPHLVYQYDFYANYETTALAAKNPEIPDD